MSKVLFELQQTIKNLREQINDLLHAGYLNKQSLICLQEDKYSMKLQNEKILASNQSNLFQSIRSQQQENQLLIKLKSKCFQSMFNEITENFKKRSENHLNYLIVKQIEHEELSVRSDRLTQYEDKIFDQRRLISDKQIFLENLYHPKKKRPQNMNLQEFQQLRVKQKIEEQKQKVSHLQKQVKLCQKFRKLYRPSTVKLSKGLSCIVTQQKSNILKKLDLQSTKSNSFDCANTPNLTIDPQQKISDSQIQKLQQNVSNKTVLQNDKQNISKLSVTSLIEQIKSRVSLQLNHSEGQDFSLLLQKINSIKRLNHNRLKQLIQTQQQNRAMQKQLQRARKTYTSIKRQNWQCQ